MDPAPGSTIRRATDDDSRGILACLHEAFEPYRAEYTPAAFLDTVLTAETLGARLREMTVLVAVVEGGEVIGTIAHARAATGEGHIRGMAVRLAWQGRGVAQRLLEAAEAGLRSAGCTRVTLDTTLPLARATRFYERNGYAPSGRVTDFFGMPLVEYHKEFGGAEA